MKQKIGAIIQARTSSTRLPGKVLKELPYGSGITALAQVIRRLKRSKKIDDIIIATTTGKEDDVIVDISAKERVKHFRGSKEDVLSRYYLSARENNLDVIVRITSDCPCIDPDIVDSIIEKHLKTKADYTSNTLKRTYPHGLDAEAVSFKTLEDVYNNADRAEDKEHVTFYIERNAGDYKIEQIESPRKLYAPDIRITLDTEEDYCLLSFVYDYLYIKDKPFTAYDIVKLFKEKPWLKLITKKIVQKKIFDTLKEELKEAINVLKLQDLKRASDFLNNYLLR